jgi:hypothetical protein
MKISGKVYILITNTFILRILIRLHNSLNPRLDSLAIRDDNLPVHVSHSLQDLGPKGGQGVMRVFIDLSLNFAPHEII